MSGKRRAAAGIATALTTLGALVAGGPASVAGTGQLGPVVEELDGPRGVAVDRAGRVVFSQADGSFSQVIDRGRHMPKVRTLGSVPAGFIAPAVAVSKPGRVFVLTAGGPPGTGAGTLYRWTPGSEAPQAVADIMAYQQTDPDPYDLEDHPDESNPFGVAALRDGSVLVADAAGNDLLRVYPNGEIVTVARVKPRVVEVPEELPDEFEGQPLPPAGTPIPAEAVTTSVAVGSDGSYYVGELRGFPATPGTSQIWRIEPGSVDAVCDPEQPNQGPCQRYADGFTSLVDVASGPSGGVYAVELVQQSWLQWELGLADPPIGGLFHVGQDGERVELASGQLVLPGGVDVGHGGKVYVTGPVFGPGALSRVD